MSIVASGPTISLRPGVAADVDALLALEQATFATDQLSRRSLRHFLTSRGARLIVAEKGSRIVGYALVAFRPRSDAARLYSIAVAADATGRGIGSMLLTAAEDAARERGCDRLRLEVHVRNAAALDRYRKAGYRQFGRHHEYYDDGGDALRLEKRLAGSSTGGNVASSPVPSFAR